MDSLLCGEGHSSSWDGVCVKHGMGLALKVPSWDSDNSRGECCDLWLFSLFAPFATCLGSSWLITDINKKKAKHLSKDDDILGRPAAEA